MTNHRTREFLTSLPESETWITPGWCSRKPDFRMPDGCGTRANCDNVVDLIVMTPQEMSKPRPCPPETIYMTRHSTAP